VSLAFDPVSELAEDASRLAITSPFLADAEGSVSEAYNSGGWTLHGGEPGHVFVLVDEQGAVRWVKDYAARENGGLMYVEVDEIHMELVKQMPTVRTAKQ